MVLYFFPNPQNSISALPKKKKVAKMNIQCFHPDTCKILSNENIAIAVPNKVAPLIYPSLVNFILLTSFNPMVKRSADIYKRVSALNTKKYTRDFDCSKSSQSIAPSIHEDLTPIMFNLKNGS